MVAPINSERGRALLAPLSMLDQRSDGLGVERDPPLLVRFEGGFLQPAAAVLADAVA